MPTKKKTTTTRTRKAKPTKEETIGGVDGAEKKPIEEKEPKKSDENARPPMTRGRKLDATAASYRTGGRSFILPNRVEHKDLETRRPRVSDQTA